MPSHSEVIIKFTKSLETSFFTKLKQQPNWSRIEIEAEFLHATIETLIKTINEITKEFNNLLTGGK